MVEVAVDPRVTLPGSWVYVQPNSFGTTRPFYVGDSGGAIVRRHVDIYDSLGRASQQALGWRSVSVTVARTPRRTTHTAASPPADAARRARGAARGSRSPCARPSARAGPAAQAPGPAPDKAAEPTLTPSIANKRASLRELTTPTQGRPATRFTRPTRASVWLHVDHGCRVSPEVTRRVAQAPICDRRE